MDAIDDERTAAARLPDGDVVAVLLRQHARIRELFAEVRNAKGEARQEAFDRLRALLAVHETAEELVLRPVSRRTAGQEEAGARNAEEAEATKMLKRLERLDVSGPEFAQYIGEFEQAVGEHADNEEREEFPTVVAGCTEEQRQGMGQRLLKAEHLAPTHPHPTAAGKRAALALTGPFAAMVDKVRDSLGG
jgi:hemerythrin superfamily protein